jgi:hypothetical protein
LDEKVTALTAITTKAGGGNGGAPPVNVNTGPVTIGTAEKKKKRKSARLWRTPTGELQGEVIEQDEPEIEVIP